MALSVHTSFAMLASLEYGLPWSLSRAAERYVARADSTAAAMSDNKKASPWWSMIGAPNVVRSLAYPTAASRAPWESPVATAPLPNQPETRAAQEEMNTAPS